MSEKKMFYKTHFLLFLTRFIFILLILLPFSLFANQKASIELLNRMEESRKSTIKIIEMHLNRLNSCKNKCMNPPCNMGRCGQSKSAAQCEATECSKHKRLYEQYKTELAKIEKQIADLKSSMANNNRQAGTQNTEDTQERARQTQNTENVIQKVDRGKKNAKTQRLLGVGVTAGLTAKAAACYSSCAGSCGCHWWAMGAVATGVMTSNIKDQERKFERTQNDLCAANPNAAGCDPDNKPKGAGLKAPDPFPPSCYQPGVNCEKINEIIQGLDTTSKPCPPGDSSCSKQAPGLITGGDFREKLGEQILEVYKPKGGWPKGFNPKAVIAENRGLSYNDMPPEMKRKIDKYLKNTNKMNKDYAGQAKAASGTLHTDHNGAAGTELLASLDDLSEASAGDGLRSTAGTGAFSGDKDHSPTSLSSSEETASDKKKSSLAKQMNKMLSSLYNNPDAKDPYAEKSLNFGSDSIGVMEDNIFMMVHRRHRALDDQNYFVVKKDF